MPGPAGLLVVMSMATAVIVLVIAVIIVLMVVLAMIMHHVAMRMAGVRIGAGFGIERRLDLDHAPAKALHHRLDDVVAADAQRLWRDLRRQMAVAEMPADPDQMLRIAPADFGERLGRGDHLDQPA